MKIRAPASCGPTREIALLIADPRPELRTGTEVINAVVSGATMTMIPIPKMMLPGRKSIQYDSGGRYVPAWLGTSFHGVLDDGTRANHRTPSAMMSGPTAMKMRGPYLAARLPNRGEKKIRKIDPGIPAAPAAAAVYPRVPCWKRPM